MNISLASTVTKKLPKNKKNWPGLKKGSGQLASNGYGYANGGSSGEGVGGDGGGVGESFQSNFSKDLLSAVTWLNELIVLAEAAPPLERIGQADPDVESVPGDSPGDEQRDDMISGEESIRIVPGAYMVYKKEVGTGDFEELWIYKVDPDNFDPKDTPLKAILAGTDIPVNSNTSEDGTQTYSLWTAGNAQYVHIRGLPN